MSEGLGIGKIIDRHKLDVLVLERGAQDVATDAAESINPYFYSHDSSEKEFDCDRRITGQLGRLLMVTGGGTRRKRHTSPTSVPCGTAFLRGAGRNLEIRIGFRPQQRHARQPVLGVDQFAGAGELAGL